MKAHDVQTSLVSPEALLVGPSRLTVELEQIAPSEVEEAATASDVYRMWASAASGVSARWIRPTGCPATVSADGKISIQLGFYAWPSELDLSYKLTSSIGTIGPRISARLRRENTYIVNNSNTLDLPYYLDTDTTVSWLSPAYDRNGQRIQTPSHVNHHTWLEFDTEVFGVLRVGGTALGHRYVLSITVDKNLREVGKSAQEQIDEAYARLKETNMLLVSKPTKVVGSKITGLTPTITATWVDERGIKRGSNANLTDKNQLQLKLPKCVEDLLSMCPDEFSDIIELLCTSVSTRQVYFSTCSGNVIYIHDGKNPTDFCSEVDGSVAGTWGIGL